MDGKSTDTTTGILKKYGKNIRWVSKKDKGQTDAINRGIKQAGKKSFDFFAYINSDDYYLPGTFEKVTQAFAEHPEAMWLVGDCQIVDARGGRIQKPIQWYKKIWRDCYQPWMLLVLNPFPQPAVFLRYDAVKKIGSFDQQLRYVMDYEYWLRLQEKFGPPFFLHDELAAFRIHNTSKSGTQFTKQFSEELQVVKHFTKQPVSLFLHRLHNGLIIRVYSLIK